ncbi:hypothetical protein BDU57DRAFT_597285 [Ampelomyces quisqualis]|uniref:Mid2 domain-containing protein n=1 Tax=Ampelomyces quisqualis TaxID=50730 RepID=A0A6A5QBK3_AMPQU|nr:hypothetical protein BDU57DRAFT_597285 [Ampelomyces quisqualis]
MHYTALFAAFSFFANTVSVSALPDKAPTPTTAPRMLDMRNCTDTSMLHHRTMSAPHGRYNTTMAKPTGKPHPPGCQCPTCMPPHPVPTFPLTHPVPGHVSRKITASGKQNCTDKCDLRKSPSMARSFNWPSSTPSPSSSSLNITLRAVSSIKPPVAPKSVHGNTALAIGLAAAALALIVGGPGAYVLWRWVKKGKGKGKGGEKNETEVVRASRIGGEGEAWDVRSVREVSAGKV